MGSFVKQHCITTDTENTYCIATLPSYKEGTFDLHIINIATNPVKITLWTTSNNSADIDLSGIWEADTEMQIGDNLLYSGKPFAGGQSLYIKILPLVIDEPSTLSIQFTGHTY